MTRASQTKTKLSANPGPVITPAPGGFIQRKCDCGGGVSTAVDGKCEECSGKQLKVQRSVADQSESYTMQPSAEESLRRPAEPLDAGTLTQTPPGHDFGRVRVQTALLPASQKNPAVGAPDDEYEKEADRVAEQILGQPYTALTGPHRQPSADEAMVRRKPDSRLLTEVDGGSAAVGIQELKGGGHPLPASARSFFEPRFGHDFGQVRLHTDKRAEESARELGARAYTIGTDIAFGAGQYSPETASGRRLLAHELTHVLQQRRGASLKIRMAHLSDFKDKDEMHDPSKLTDAQIEATDEFKAYMNPALVWQTTDKVTREEALLSCRLMLRHLREGHPIVWSSDARVFMNLARNQLGTLKATEGEVGKLEWVPFSSQTAASDPSKLKSDFGKWLLAGGPEPDKGTGKVNCWEMILFSAYKGGLTSKARIEGIYNEGVKQVQAGARNSVGDTVEAELRRGKENILDLNNPKSPEPLPGDIVIFTTAANHAAISTGTKDGSGRHKIISHWPPPDGSYKTKETTIEELLGAMAPGTVVKFWSPKW